MGSLTSLLYGMNSHCNAEEPKVVNFCNLFKMYLSGQAFPNCQYQFLTDVCTVRYLILAFIAHLTQGGMHGSPRPHLIPTTPPHTHSHKCPILNNTGSEWGTFLT